MRDAFDALMAVYGYADDCQWSEQDHGYIRRRAYYDGGWIQGYRVEPVTYWGA